MSIIGFDAHLTCMSLSKMVLSINRPTFKILFVPNGCEQNAKMELNEK